MQEMLQAVTAGKRRSFLTGNGKEQAFSNQQGMHNLSMQIMLTSVGPNINHIQYALYACAPLPEWRLIAMQPVICRYSVTARTQDVDAVKGRQQL